MNKILFASIFLVLFASSCSKSSDDTIAPIPEVYMNMTAGSVWNYERIDNVAPTSTTLYTLTSTNRDSTISGKSYHVYSNSIGPNEYYNISNTYDLYTYQTLPSFLTPDKKVNLYLITNQAKDFIWEQNYGITFGGLPQTLNLKNTIADKGLTKIVNGISYSSVIHVKTQLSVVGLAPGILVSDINSYYAPKVGLIENSTIVTYTVVGIPTTVNTITRLKTATLL